MFLFNISNFQLTYQKKEYKQRIPAAAGHRSHVDASVWMIAPKLQSQQQLLRQQQPRPQLLRVRQLQLALSNPHLHCHRNPSPAVRQQQAAPQQLNPASTAPHCRPRRWLDLQHQHRPSPPAAAANSGQHRPGAPHCRPHRWLDLQHRPSTPAAAVPAPPLPAADADASPCARPPGNPWPLRLWALAAVAQPRSS